MTLQKELKDASTAIDSIDLICAEYKAKLTVLAKDYPTGLYLYDYLAMDYFDYTEEIDYNDLEFEWYGKYHNEKVSLVGLDPDGKIKAWDDNEAVYKSIELSYITPCDYVYIYHALIGRAIELETQK